jgi:X-X-X-Leu-X-X-Gly heptad repeat protein
MAGTDMIRPANSGSMQAIRLAAHALADLHTSTLADGTQQLRAGADEAAKAAKRSKVLQAYAPGMAEHIDQVTSELCERLSTLRTDRSWPAHGSFKPSQLLYRADSVFVVDFDQFCLADPALDVGYFLAYLRPPGLWYRRAGARAWFRRAAQTFLGAYGDALHQHGVAPSTSSEIVSRSAVYEAALLLKITTRRANRLHSPRPAEIEAMMSEISNCLAGEIGFRHDGGRSGGERQGGFDPVE